MEIHLYNEHGRMMNKIQGRTILKDKQKAGYIKKHFGIPILYLWESDIKKNKDLCKKLIEEFVFYKGCIQNYNSFNYIVLEDDLCLKDKVLESYQEVSSDEYLKYIKNS